MGWRIRRARKRGEGGNGVKDRDGGGGGRGIITEEGRKVGERGAGIIRGEEHKRVNQSE